MVTVFSKITDTENPFYKEIDEVLNSFKDGSNAKKIEAIRNENDKEKRNIAKSKLVSVIQISISFLICSNVKFCVFIAFKLMRVIGTRPPFC